jgi:hypothetical protein
MYDWKSWRTLTPLILSFIGMIAFVSTDFLSQGLYNTDSISYYTPSTLLQTLSLKAAYSTNRQRKSDILVLSFTESLFGLCYIICLSTMR